MMKSKSKRLSTSIRKKLTFRRRNKTDDDDDLLSLSGMEPLNPSPLMSTPNMASRYSNGKLRKNKSMTPVQPKSTTMKTTTPSMLSLRRIKSRKDKFGVLTTPSPSTPFAEPEHAAGNSRTFKRRNDMLSPQSQRDFNRMVQAAQALDNAANEFFAKGRYEQALTAYTRALQLKKRSLTFGVLDKESDNAQQLLASVATSINNIGYLRQRNGGGTSSEIMAAYQDSLCIKREILGKEDLSVGKTLNNIGSVYFGTRQYANAMVAYQEACDILALHLGEAHLDVATVHSNIGDVHLAQRQLVEARAEYAVALEIRWAHLEDVNPKVVRLLEKVAAIDMADTPEMIEEIKVADDEDFIVEEGDQPVTKQLHELGEAVQQDVAHVEQLERDMALEMIRDKVQMMREMRELENGVLYDHDHKGERMESPASLTASEREQALTEIKNRVESMKRRKSSSCSRRRYNNNNNNSNNAITPTDADDDTDRVERERARVSSNNNSMEEDHQHDATAVASNNLQAKFEAAALF